MISKIWLGTNLSIIFLLSSVNAIAEPEEKTASDRNSKIENTDPDSEAKTERKMIIAVSRDPFLAEQPETVAAINVSIDDAVTPPDSILSFIENTPGVSANGQGGMFQTYSIRGIAKHRIRSLVDGIPIITERRAGVSASFIEPNLLQSADVVRGPVSTFYGSGALGGAVNLYLIEPADSRLSLGYQSQGDGVDASFAHAFESSSFGFSHRDYGRSEAANGEALNDGFTSTNALFRHHWQVENTEYSVWWLGADARDIGKSNLRYPDERITNYPKESHQLAKLTATNSDGWQWSLYAHPNRLVTENIRVGSRVNTTKNESFDVGGHWQSRFKTEGTGQTQWGIDWFSRRDVNATETETRFDNNESTYSVIIDDGQLDDLALFISSYIETDDMNYHLGARYNWQRESVYGSSSITDDALSGFVGIDWNISNEWHGFTNIATGFRFPTLSERFFTGTTARGTIVSAIDLVPERSKNVDIGLRWENDHHRVILQTFLMDVDNYIERITLNNGDRTYVNLNNGEIVGSELSYRWHSHTQSIDIAYMRYIGKDDNNQYLSDIPADKLTVGYIWNASDWSAKASWTHRREKNQFGDGEVASKAFNVLSAGAHFQVNRQWSLDIAIDNLLDELYIASNDDLDTWAQGRNLSIKILWQPR